MTDVSSHFIFVMLKNLLKSSCCASVFTSVLPGIVKVVKPPSRMVQRVKK